MGSARDDVDQKSSQQDTLGEESLNEKLLEIKNLKPPKDNDKLVSGEDIDEKSLALEEEELNTIAQDDNKDLLQHPKILTGRQHPAYFAHTKSQMSSSHLADI